LDQAILHTVVHHLWTNVRMYVRTDGHLISALLGRLSKSRP